MGRGYNFAVRIAVCRTGWEESQASKAAFAKEREVLGKLLLWAPNGSSNLCFLSQHLNGFPWLPVQSTEGRGSSERHWKHLMQALTSPREENTALLSLGSLARLSIKIQKQKLHILRTGMNAFFLSFVTTSQVFHSSDHCSIVRIS